MAQNELQREPRTGITPRYMVVDDERIIADINTHILNISGYPCISAYDGYEAILKARQIRPRFILMGVVMPWNGIDAAIAILKEQPECCICLFSSSRYIEDMLEQARSQGYDFTIFAKPIHPADLLRKLSELGFEPETAPPSV